MLKKCIRSSSLGKRNEEEEKDADGDTHQPVVTIGKQEVSRGAVAHGLRTKSRRINDAE